MTARLSFVLLAACATAAQPKAEQKKLEPMPGERHFSELKQLTFGGENAEAYWSFDGKQLSLQAHMIAAGAKHDAGCDRIYRMPIDTAPKMIPVSNGKGATTCAYFLPGDQEVIYASTQLGGDACPNKADRSQGYVWSLYTDYDIFKSKVDGTGIERLTETPGYDAEGTVCPVDGSIIFTSVRDGDLELYRMDKDGKNVKRLTHSIGYDGGAFFSPDCKKIVWRASRPKPGPEQEDYKRLLDQAMVRPSKLELYVANADGSDATQITYLDAASFAPFFHPSGKRIVFSSNYGDPKGREFDIWAVNTDGTGLERITTAPGFDGFPMFSPDGRTLAFSSNRATEPGKGDTNVFIAAWNDVDPQVVERAEDRIARDVAWLASPAREGRGTGSDGLVQAADYIEARFKTIPGLKVERQTFKVTTKVEAKQPPVVKINGKAIPATALASSASGKVKGKLLFANYGLELGKEAKDAIVLVRRFVPEGTEPSKGDIRKKAWLAREKGAKALLVVDLPDVPKDKMPPEAGVPSGAPESYADSGIPVLMLKREDGVALLKAKATVEIDVQLEPVQTEVSNIIALHSGKGDPIVIGAHYDHLGMGGRFSLAPDQHAAHGGADDNASGTAALLEAAAHAAEIDHAVAFVAFSAEELGVLGSTFYVRQLERKPVLAMLNMDMVGRLHDNKVQVLGGETAKEWSELLDSVCKETRIECQSGGGGYGPSDQTPFYAAGIPVLHFFTGAHGDYHKPSDTADKINYAGVARIAATVDAVANAVSKPEQPLSFNAGAASMPLGGDRRSFNASLGTVPDYAGPPAGTKGVLLAGTRPGSAADKAGLKRGDVLQKLGTHAVAGVEDLMFALNASKPGETVTATFLRDGKEERTQVTFEERKGH